LSIKDEKFMFWERERDEMVKWLMGIVVEEEQNRSRLRWTWRMV
jgi:hypothetical protein